jgi:hypothetical protein
MAWLIPRTPTTTVMLIVLQTTTTVMESQTKMLPDGIPMVTEWMMVGKPQTASMQHPHPMQMVRTGTLTVMV